MTSLLLATSNGTGMGHLTRQVAVARALHQDVEATLFSLSLGLPVAASLGCRGEYCPSYDRPWIASGDWHNYLGDRLVAIVEETESDAVLFDGVAPYPGIGMASRALRDVAFVWIRRGMWRAGTGGRHLAKSAFFDLIIEPGDLGSAEDRGQTADRRDAERVGPISILESIDLLPRSEARVELGLPQEGKIALVTLGSGRLGDVAGPGAVAIETLSGGPEWHIAVTKSPVALNEIPLDTTDQITQISSVFPLARYLGAFDLAVSSAGYNAVHELIPAGLPTLLVANTSTRTDDQLARATGVANAGYALSSIDTDPEQISKQLWELLDDEKRVKIAAAAKATAPMMTGAADVGRTAAEFASTFTRRRRSLETVARSSLELFKTVLRDALGEETTARLKRVLGREPSPRHQRSPVRLSGTKEDSDLPELSVVRDLTSDDLNRDGPVEHLIPGSSDAYEATRREMIRRYYDVIT